MKELEETEEMCYLGSIIEGNKQDIERRSKKRFHFIEKNLDLSIISKQTKLRLFKTSVKSALLYGTET